MASLDKIAIASDHGAVEMKNMIVEQLRSMGYEPVDMGVYNTDPVDYPDYGARVANEISLGAIRRGILLCGTGIGMSITANKFPGVRAALVNDSFTAKMSREHNNSNILVLGGRVTQENVACDILRIWLETPYEGGRHDRRLDKITAIEKEQMGDR